MINKIAIVGLGSIGNRYLEILNQKFQNLEIAIVRSQKSKNVNLEKYEIHYSLNSAVNSNIDAAIICTPASLHLEQSLYLIKNDIHVLIEKPLSNLPIKNQKLENLLKKKNLVGLLGYCFRFDEAALKYKDLISNLDHSKILHVSVDCGSYLPNWRKNKNYKKSVSSKKSLGGGVLLELSHEIDFINWFFGDLHSVTSHVSNTKNLDIDVEDQAEIIFETKEGFPIYVHLDFNSKYSERRKCIVRTSEGEYSWDAISKKLNWTEDNKEKIKIYKNDANDKYTNQLNHFFDCIYENKKPKVSLKDGKLVLDIIELIRESSSKGRKLFIS